MIFSELYSAYYNAVAAILKNVTEGERDEKILRETASKHAFSESVLTILPALKSERWQLLKGDMTTPIKNIPTMPLTLLEKRWLKSLSYDPRVRLFDISFEGLEDVEPLFTPDDYVIYDKYADGDPYLDEGYISRFRIILSALREKTPLCISALNRRGNTVKMYVMPIRLEYSEKDDKFRLISKGCRYGGTVNLARIVSCERCEEMSYLPQDPPVLTQTVTFELYDERNALERCMLHFAHFEKQVRRLDKGKYLVHIRYDKDDETEMVIRLLGFGPHVKVTEPEYFRGLMIDRLLKQKSCEL